jgi:ATP-binding cassette, subfamily B, bacterial
MNRVFTTYDWGERSTETPIRKESLLRIIRYFYPYRKLLFLSVGCILISAGLGLLQPVLIKQIIDIAIPQKKTTYLLLLIIGMVIAAIGSGVVGVVQTYLNTRIGQGVMFDIRNQMYSHLHRMSIQFFTNNKTGDIMSRVNNDVNGLQAVVTDTVSNSLSNLIIAVSTLATMYALDPYLATLSLLILPVFIIPTKRVGRLNFHAKKATQEKMGELSSLMQETLSVSGAILVKAFGRHDWEVKRFAELNRQLMQLQIRQSMIGRWFFVFIGIISTAGPAIIYGFGGWEVIQDHLSLGTVVAFTALLTRLYGPISALTNVQVNVLGSIALFERLFEYLDIPVDVVERPDAVHLSSVKGHIVFDRVCYHYQEEREILHEISLTIEPGQVVALVGPSGSGKTTLSGLIPRFYDVTKGRVLIDGHDVRDVSLRSLSDHIGLVTQETFLFHATIRENLLYGNPHASEEEMIAAAKAASIHELIMSLPEGYETVVGERGYKLSGGEKQRIAIARVILKNPKILILDEATSALDSHSESLVQAALDELMKERTSIVIAHRLSTILSADQIFVIADGRVVEQGTHHELLANNGLYADLYRKQSL